MDFDKINMDNAGKISLEDIFALPMEARKRLYRILRPLAAHEGAQPPYSGDIYGDKPLAWTAPKVRIEHVKEAVFVAKGGDDKEILRGDVPGKFMCQLRKQAWTLRAKELTD